MLAEDGVEMSFYPGLQRRICLLHIRTTLCWPIYTNSVPCVQLIGCDVPLVRVYLAVVTWVFVCPCFSAEACHYYCELSEKGAVAKKRTS